MNLPFIYSSTASALNTPANQFISRNMGIDSEDVVHSLVCDQCWNTLFDPHGFQQAWEASGSTERHHGGFTYKTSWSQIRQSSEVCAWCNLLAKEIPESHSFITGNASPSPQQVFKIKTRFKPSSEGSSSKNPAGRNTLVVEIDDAYVQLYEVHADPGMFVIFHQLLDPVAMWHSAAS